jgi:hypothetical protein
MVLDGITRCKQQYSSIIIKFRRDENIHTKIEMRKPSSAVGFFFIISSAVYALH